MTWFMHLQTEDRHWTSIVKPMAEKYGLHWGLNPDYDRATITASLVSPAAVNKPIRIDVDRANRSEKEIMIDLEKAIAKLMAIK
jgi:hypothetical protein